MSGTFNPLQDLAAILGSFAKALPPLPAPPFPLPKPPTSGKVESPSSPSGGYVDITDEVAERQMERHRAEQEARGIITFHYE